jgi:hypothetical protein
VRLSPISAVILVLATTSGSAVGQMTAEVLPSFGGGSSGLASVGDVNGDGAADLIVGAQLDSTSAWLAGAIRVYSGSDGSLLLQVLGQHTGDHFGAAVAGGGDINGDGVPDLLVGVPYADLTATNAGAVQVLSGLDGSPLLTVPGSTTWELFGQVVASLRDISGDGVPDFVVGVPGWDGNGADAGKVVVVSGATGQVLYAVQGDGAGTLLGWDIAGIGDVDGDLRMDFAVSAPGGVAGQGYVRVLSGADGSTLTTLAGVESYFVRRATDFDADGISDVLVQYSYVARVYSSVTGMQLAEFGGAELSLSVASADIVGDINGDGIVDVAAGLVSGNETSGAAKVYSGADGATLLIHPGVDLIYPPSFGKRLVSLGDVDGDGHPEFAVDGGTVGVHILSCAPSPWSKQGGGAGPWPPPLIAPYSTLEAQHPIQLLLFGGLAGTPAWLVVGMSAINLPFKGGILKPAPDVIVFAGLTDAAGQVKLQGSVPASAPSGLELWCQWWIVNAAAAQGFAATQAVKGTVP